MKIMKTNRLYRMFEQVPLRWTTALAVLFYVLLPQTGFCLCEGCDCSNKPPTLKEMASNCCKKSDGNSSRTVSNQAVSETPRGCCCSKKKDVAADACCSKKSVAENPFREGSASSEPCECGCSVTKDSLPPVQDTPNSSQQVWEELKEQLQIVYAFPISPEPVFDAVSPDDAFETAVSRLPVRLHLMLLVLRN